MVDERALREAAEALAKYGSALARDTLQLLDELQQANAEQRRLREALEALQHRPDGATLEPSCAWCRARFGHPHRPACIVALALGTDHAAVAAGLPPRERAPAQLAAAWNATEGWREVNDEAVGGSFVPSAPKGEWYAVRGVLRLFGQPEYPDTAAELAGHVLTVIVQRQIDPGWGLRVWLRERRPALEFTDRWFLQSTHVQNTLLADPGFAAVVGCARP